MSNLPQLPTTKPVTASAGPLGTLAETWTVSWNSANSVAAPFVVMLSSSMPSSTPPAADVAEVTAYWSDGPTGTTLQDVGVTSYSPPTGAGATLLQAIDAAVLAACAVYGSAVVLADADAALRLTLASAWIVWTIAGGTALPGGGGGSLETLRVTLG